jgi:RNA polymerase sigma-70 factor (ECF subfamily)
MAERSTPEASQRHEAPASPDLAGLVRQHHAAVYGYAFRLCGAPAEAEDLTQQTFLIAQQKLGQLREPERARGWLLAIARSCFLKSRRKARPLSAADVELAVDEIAAPVPEAEAIDREQLAATLAELPDEFRLVLLMFYFEDLSYQAIAEALEIPIGTVMSRLSRAKAHLRRRLSGTASEPTLAAPARRGETAAGAKIRLTRAAR